MNVYTSTLTHFLLFSTMLSAPLMAQTEINPIYDQSRAEKVGADEYGMKRYVMAFLSRGPNRDRSKAEADELQRLHMSNIGRLAEEGKLVLAGPFLTDGKLRGIYIFDVETIEQAQQLTATDPAIRAGSLVMELVPWYGSAALMEVNAIHNTLAKTLM
ncbi:YciI family protein [Shewanella ulleungensis]|uniref:YciI family protein n=1 Tax=Shewanella ulleungensis TaxID=2282699 RepID=UPI003D78C3C7